MAFTAADVKNLREMTGVGMMDCKKALTASDGDMDKAVEWLREKGLAASVKKAGRIAAEGVAFATVSEDGKVMNVSGGTAVMKDIEGYRNISRDWIQGWGQGLALAFFSKLLVSDQIEKDGAL